MIQQLKQIEETSLLEMLDISSEDLVERFRDLIEENPEFFEQQLAEWFPNENSYEES